MFIPFIPYLLALIGAWVLLALPGGVGLHGVTGWEAALAYGALPLLGGIVGGLPQRWFGRFAGPASGLRRTVFLLAWLWVLHMIRLPQALQLHLLWLGGGEEATLMLLLVNFWLGDTLAQHRVHSYGAQRGARRAKRLWDTARLPVPILLLMVLGLSFSALFESLSLPAQGGAGAHPWLKTFGAMAAMVAIMALAMPVLVRIFWGLRPLEDRQAERVVLAELSANGVSVARVLALPEEVMGFATAGVIGMIRPFRYLMISPALAAVLTGPEIQAVTAHEAAHIKHRHLWYFLAAIVSFMLLMQVLTMGLIWAGAFTGAMPPVWVIVGIEVAALIVFFRFGIGFISRQFERQADSNALRRTGQAPFESAIAKVARINGIPVEQDNWHHYGIGRRIAYSRAAQAEPSAMARHDGKVRRIKVALLALLALGVAAQVAASSPDTVAYLGERYLVQRLEGVSAPSWDDLPALRFLAARALAREEHASSERYFRMILAVTPEDPRVKNNLAWILVTRPQPQPAALREGLALALAAARESQHAYIWDTLAESHYRLKQYDHAVIAASKAVVLAEAGQGRGDAPLRYYRNRLKAFAQFGKGV